MLEFKVHTLSMCTWYKCFLRLFKASYFNAESKRFVEWYINKSVTILIYTERCANINYPSHINVHSIPNRNSTLFSSY